MALEKNKIGFEKRASNKLSNLPEEGDFEDINRVAEGVSESVSLDEGAENLGDVSEKTRKSVAENKAKSIKGSKQLQDTYAQQFDALTRRQATRQIENEIEKLVSQLRKEAMKMARSGRFSPYELNNMLRKIRSLKGILNSLLKASLEKLRTYWLRYVHGVN